MKAFKNTLRLRFTGSLERSHVCFCVGHVSGLSSGEAKGMDATWLNNFGFLFLLTKHVLNFVGEDYVYYIIDFILVISSILIQFIEWTTHFYITDSVQPQMSFDVSPQDSYLLLSLLLKADEQQ